MNTKKDRNHAFLTDVVDRARARAEPGARVTGDERTVTAETIRRVVGCYERAADPGDAGSSRVFPWRDRRSNGSEHEKGTRAVPEERQSRGAIGRCDRAIPD